MYYLVKCIVKTFLFLITEHTENNAIHYNHNNIDTYITIGFAHYL